MSQVFAMLASLLFVLTAMVTQSRCDDCDPAKIERYFEEPPNAWKLVQNFDDIFYLLYHSKNYDFDKDHFCLWALRQNIFTAQKKATYRFSYFDGSKTVTGSVNVEARKSDKAYEHENYFLVSDPMADSTPVAKKEKLPAKQSSGKRDGKTYQLLFTDYESCAVLKSSFLGVQVWATEGYLKKHNDVPYGCSLAYDLMADQNKTITYDWRKCGVFKHTEL
uniref:Putative salivary lipocalin n=1 Tax=Ixodes ricinus TaxID=34613 RepID=A0A0K8RKP6_IXORI